MKNKFVKVFSAMLAMSVLMITAGCSGGASKATPSPAATAKATASAPKKVAAAPLDEKLLEKKINITIEMEDGGVMKGELYPDLAPLSVENFVKLANEHFYDGLVFHRVIPDFMIQGGGYDINGQEKDTASIKGEFNSNGVENQLKHTRGVLSMARTSVKDSASSQFFIMHADYPSLDGEYAAFGKITEGLDVVDKIAQTETTTKNGMSDYPATPQVIKTITVQQ